MGMANNRDGGIIAIGVDEQKGTLVPTGLTPDEEKSWKYDDLLVGLSKYTDPPADFDVDGVEMSGKQFIVVRVHEFDDVPILCAVDYQSDLEKLVLRKGACYVRSRGRRETTEIPSQTEMRDLLELATEKRLRRFLATAEAAGIKVGLGEARPSDATRFADQLRDLA